MLSSEVAIGIMLRKEGLSGPLNSLTRLGASNLRCLGQHTVHAQRRLQRVEFPHVFCSALGSFVTIGHHRNEHVRQNLSRKDQVYG